MNASSNEMRMTAIATILQAPTPEKRDQQITSYLEHDTLNQLFLDLKQRVTESRGEIETQQQIIDCVEFLSADHLTVQEQASAKWALSLASYYAGDKPRALALNEEVLYLFQEIGDVEASCLQIANRIMLIVDIQGDFQTADLFAQNQEAYVLEHVTADTRTAVRFYWHWAIVKHYKQEISEAISIMDKGWLFVRDSNDPDLVARFQQDMASFHIYDNQFSKALSLLKKARAAFQEREDRQYDLGINSYNMADCYFRMGQLYEALSWADDCMVLVRPSGTESDEYRRSYLMLGQILLALNQPENVLSRLTLLGETDNNLFTYSQLSRLKASVLAKVRQYAEAISILERVIFQVTRQNDAWYIFTQILIVRIYLEWYQHTHERAIRDRGFAYLSQIDSQGFFTVERLILQAQYRFAFNDFEKTAVWLTEIEALESIPPHLHTTYHDMRGQLAEVAGNTQLASEHYLQAITQTEQIGQQIKQTIMQAHFVTQHKDVYQRLFAIMVKLSEWSLLWSYLEQQRANTLFTLSVHDLHHYYLSDKREEMKERLDQYHRYQAEHLELSQHLYQESENSEPLSLDEEAQMRKRIYDLSRYMAEILDLFQEDKEATALSLSEVCAGLDRHTAVLHYTVIGQKVVVLGADANGLCIHQELTASWSDIQDNIRWFHRTTSVLTQAKNGQSFLDEHGNLVVPESRYWRNLNKTRLYLGELYKQLWQPIAAHLYGRFQHITLVADEDLLTLPFSALYDEPAQRYVIDDYTISYAPSASIYTHCRSRKSDRKHNVGSAIAVFAHNGEVARPLHHALGEANGVHQIYPDAQLYLGVDANEKNLRQASGTAKLLHLAMHGRDLTNRANPLDCCLLLAPDKGQEINPFYVYDLARLNLWENDLITLSACYTGQSRNVGGHLLGLQWGVFNAGAYALLGNMSKVNDKITADLMPTFYRHLESGLNKADALRQAQLDLRQQGEMGNQSNLICAHPFVWSSFAFFGYAQ